MDNDYLHLRHLTAAQASHVRVL